MFVSRASHLVCGIDLRDRCLRVVLFEGAKKRQQLLIDGGLITPPWQHPRSCAHVEPPIVKSLREQELANGDAFSEGVVDVLRLS